MKPATLLALGVLGALTLSQNASGQTILLQDNFNSYNPQVSSQIDGAWPTANGTLSFVGPNPGAGGGAFTNNLSVAANGHGERYHAFTATTPTDIDPLVLQFSLYDSGSGAARGDIYGELRNSANTLAGAQSNPTTTLFDAGLIPTTTSVGTFNQTKYQARDMDFNSGWIQLATSRSVGWHTFELVIKASTASLLIDGTVDANFNNLPWNGGSFNMVELGSSINPTFATTAMNIDNVLVTIPEPSTVLLTIVGGLGIAVWSIRRRAK